METNTAENLVGTPTRFENLIESSALLASLSAQGISEPTPVQMSAIPLIKEGHDLLVQAKTGSGKTLAFMLPLLEFLEQIPDTRTTVALVIAPTRELALQIRDVVRSISSTVKPACLIGGVSFNEQSEALKEDRRLIVGTPGRLLDYMQQRIFTLRNCEFFVIDEVDEMFSMDFIQDITTILSRLPDERQGVFVSATVTPRVEALANQFMDDPQKVYIKSTGEEAPPIEHLYFSVTSEVTAKANLLCDIIEVYNPRSAIIFCNTKSDTELVEKFLRRRGFDARLLNSDLSQSQRERIINSLKNGSLRLLVGTDLAARGLDVKELDLVVNYALPDSKETYTHRTGRTGRAGKNGRAISLIGPQDFAGFMALKRDFPTELAELPPLSETEVQQARIAHLQALIRNLPSEQSTRDEVLAKHYLKQVGGVEEPSEELVHSLTKLITSFLEIHVEQTRSKELRGEMPAPASRQEYGGGRDRRHSGDRRRSGRGRDHDRRGRR